MNVPALLVGLYPPAIRQRWGREIARDVRLAGPRCWLDTAVGATKLWLHPSDWPETSPGQTRRVLAAALVTVFTIAGVWIRAAGPGAPTARVDHPVSSVWIVPILAALVLAMPLPPPRRAELGRLVATVARTLIAPVLALVALYLVAHSGLRAPHVLLLAYYWTSIGFVSVRLCVLMARAGRIAVVPGARRLHAALLCGGVGLAMGAIQTLAEHASLAGAVLSGGFAALAAVVLLAALDLRPLDLR